MALIMDLASCSLLRRARREEMLSTDCVASPGEGYPCLGSPRARGTCWATVQGSQRAGQTEQLTLTLHMTSH